MMFHDFQFDLGFTSLSGGRFAGVALIYKGQSHRTARNLLDLLRQLCNLAAFLFVTRRDRQRQQISQCIYCCMDFRTLLSLASVIACSTATFRRRLQRSCIIYDSRRLLVAVFQNSDTDPQIMGERFKYSSVQPTTGLLVHGRPRREVMRQISPLTSRFNHIANSVEQLTQTVISLRSVLTHQREIRYKELPFTI